MYTKQRFHFHACNAQYTTRGNKVRHIKKLKAILLFAAIFLSCIWVYPNSACAAVNKIDGFPMQGQDTGKDFTVEVAGSKLKVADLSITANVAYNLSWMEGSMDFPLVQTQDPGKVFEPFNTPLDQWESDSSWDDSKVKKVDLRFTTIDNDGRIVVSILLKNCMIFFYNGICQIKSLVGTGTFHDKSIIDFDGTDDSRETLGGASLQIVCHWPRVHR
jgi:hypothetical protein